MGRKSTRTETGLSDGQREHLERVAGPPAESPEARLAGAHRPWARLGARSGGDDSADGHVKADPVARASPFSNPPSTSPNLDKTEPDGRRPDIAHARLKPKNHPMRTNRLAKRLKIP